jgi:hypothetical protein
MRPLSIEVEFNDESGWKWKEDKIILTVKGQVKETENTFKDLQFYFTMSMTGGLSVLLSSVTIELNKDSTAFYNKLDGNWTWIGKEANDIMFEMLKRERERELFIKYSKIEPIEIVQYILSK